MADFFYLATPYSKYPGGLTLAFDMACRAQGRCVKAGIPTFCPIVHTHPVAMIASIDPLSHAIWLAADRPFMEAARGLIVLQATGWDESVGIAHETEHFERVGKPIIYWPPDLPEERLAKLIEEVCSNWRTR